MQENNVGRSVTKNKDHALIVDLVCAAEKNGQTPVTDVMDQLEEMVFIFALCQFLRH